MIPHARAAQWSRAAWALAALFATLPLSSKLFLGAWGFQGAAELSFLCLVLGTYLHIVSRRRSRALRDDATTLDRALRLASISQTEEAMSLLTQAVRQSPRFWQAYQYRGELYVRQRESWDAALQDFTEAIRLAPNESHLYELRAKVHSLLGDDRSAQRDSERAAALREPLRPDQE